MRPSFTAAIACAAAAAAATPALAAGPPPALSRALTPAGRLIWNLDALFKDTFGNRRVPCYDVQRGVFLSESQSAGCPTPWQRYITYSFTFRNAHNSQFRLVHLSKPPLFGVTDIPVFINGKYISCPGGQYHNGHTGVLVAGGDTPVGTFWCY